LAYHEGGHAVVAAILPNTDPIHKVTIVPRDRVMGSRHSGGEIHLPREYMLNRLAVMMGGRAAEVGKRWSPAARGRSQAGHRAGTHGLEWGMSESLG
jgi:cell division protease FtsH